MSRATRAFTLKLKNLENQLRVARLADYAYPDGQLALDLLIGKVSAARQRVQQSEAYSESVRVAILRDATFMIMRLTHIIGIIVRSTSVRNAFELYVPFLDICQAMVGGNAKLILSSEWQYVPFTHPQNLKDLPDFIIIGLPASESENPLVFPAAGHELGHSVWLRNGFSQLFTSKAQPLVLEVINSRRNEFDSIFPSMKGADLDQDIFALTVKAHIVLSVIAQSEEIFSDFLGLLIFGEGFLYCFEYLVSPQLTSSRSSEYPNTHRRAGILADYAESRMAVTVDNYAAGFIGESAPSSQSEALILSAAEQIVEKMLDDLFDEAKRIFAAAHLVSPTGARTDEAESAFREGVPFDGQATIGDLINAAWRIFRGGADGVFVSQGRQSADYLTDLVLKSAEINEIRKHY